MIPEEQLDSTESNGSPQDSSPSERDLYVWGEGLFLCCGSLLVLVVIFVLTTEVTLRREGEPLRASIPSLFQRVEGSWGSSTKP